MPLQHPESIICFLFCLVVVVTATITFIQTLVFHSWLNEDNPNSAINVKIAKCFIIRGRRTELDRLCFQPLDYYYHWDLTYNVPLSKSLPHWMSQIFFD